MKKYPKDYIKNEKQRRAKQLKDCYADLSLIIQNLHWINERLALEK